MKSMVKTINMTQTQVSWHLRTGPILLSPDQFIIKYPIITPRIPYRHVDAPALIPVGLQRAEKILPEMADIMYMIIQRAVPNEYSNLDNRMIVLVKFPKKCMKFICRTAAVMSLHT